MVKTFILKEENEVKSMEPVVYFWYSCQDVLKSLVIRCQVLSVADNFHC